MFVSRLPILQGGTFTLLAPSMAMLSMPEWTCPAWTQNASLVNSASPEFTEVWQTRMRAVSVQIPQLCLGIITKLAQKQDAAKALLMDISAYSTLKMCDGKKIWMIAVVTLVPKPGTKADCKHKTCIKKAIVCYIMD